MKTYNTEQEARNTEESKIASCILKTDKGQFIMAKTGFAIIDHHSHYKEKWRSS